MASPIVETNSKNELMFTKSMVMFWHLIAILSASSSELNVPNVRDNIMFIRIIRN